MCEMINKANILLEEKGFVEFDLFNYLCAMSMHEQ